MSRKKPAAPVFQTPIYETHCHLDRLKQAPLAELIAQAQSVGVERILTIAVEPDDQQTVLELADTHEAVFATQGIHPHDAERLDSRVLEQMRQGLAHCKTLAVGEIGLDYYYDHADRAVQRRVFATQLQLAVELELPVVIHTRDADDDTRAILAEHAPDLKRKGVIHSFTSSQSLADFCLDAGFMLGFNGIITFNKADNVRSVLRNTPPERLLSETDAPYLTPVPWRGHENAPHHLPWVLQRMADELQQPPEILAEHCRANAWRLFHQQEPPQEA